MTVVGFEQASYSVNENSAVIEICAVILSPSDLNELDPSFQVFVLFSVESGDAIGTLLLLNLLVHVVCSNLTSFVSLILQ